MSLWVKICGNTTLADARLAAEAGADALGFVFAPSPRQVSPGLVQGITPHLPAAVEKIGVFVDSSPEEIQAAAASAGLTGVQVHCAHSPDLVPQLRSHFGPAFRILEVLHFRPHLRRVSAQPADAVLVDSRTATAVGGTGIAFDWKALAEELDEHPLGLPLVVAGGLSPGNVEEAIATLRPWGVDVVSGVEAAPGRKDPERVRRFIENARRAHAALLSGEPRRPL